MYVLIEENQSSGIVAVSGPGTVEQLQALLPDDLMECEADQQGHRCWATESCDTSYTIVPLTSI